MVNKEKERVEQRVNIMKRVFDRCLAAVVNISKVQCWDNSATLVNHRLLSVWKYLHHVAMRTKTKGGEKQKQTQMTPGKNKTKIERILHQIISHGSQQRRWWFNCLFCTRTSMFN